MKSSTTERIGFFYYCVYCCQKAKEDFTYDEYERIDSQYCTCEQAKKEIEINKQMVELNNQKRNLKRDTKGLDQLKFERDAQIAREKYGISE